MFKCLECDKRYTKQTSLNRHVQNHQRQKRYTCETCHVSFYRCDLLSRHIKIHSTRTSSPVEHPELQKQDIERGQSSRQTRSSGVQGRQRCHTACVPCKNSRIKCDGYQPCHTCVSKEKICEYSRTGARVSQSTYVEPSLRDNETQQSRRSYLSDSDDVQTVAQPDEYHTQPTNFDYLNLGRSHDTEQSQNLLNTAVSTATGAFQDEENVSDALLNISQDPLETFAAPISETHFKFSNNNLPYNIVNDLISDSTAWPWLHENLFLQSESQGFWPDISDSYGTTNFLDQHVTENTQDETARAPMLINGDPNFVRVTDELQKESNSTTGESAWQLRGEAVQPNQETRRAPSASGRTLAEDVRHSTNNTPSRNQLINDLVSQAAQPGWVSDDKIKRSDFWTSNSTSIAESFVLQEELISSSTPCLRYFLDLYLQHFHPLWPLLSRQSLDIDVLHPILYLTLVSIGAMYGGIHSAHFGTQLHGRLRKTLIAGIDFGEFDNDLIWLCQSRLLTQVAALYFGQPRAFSYAQHLGGILVAQARRMNLFTGPRNQNEGIATGTQRPPAERLARWLFLEERRRVAFGILRAETYTSVLLNTRPLLSPEEIDLELPYADSTWRGPQLSPEIFLAIVEQERESVPRQRFSDTIRVASERNETSCLLDPYGHELLIFGLQQSVWRFSHDPSIFMRLTATAEVPIQPDYDGLELVSQIAGSVSAVKSTRWVEQDVAGMTGDHLGASPRHMADLKADLDRLMSALHKWKQSLQLIRTAMHLGQDRNTVLSSLLLYHLSYLRLRTPLEDMHYISYRTAEKVVVEKHVIETVSRWANSRDGFIAGQHACTIWQLMCRELQRPEESRAKFNFLAFAGLHHAAVVVWTLAGARDGLPETLQKSLVIEPLVVSDPGIAVHAHNSRAILTLFSKGFDCATPARWSSFSAAALRLSACQFPSP